jgi:MFS transporter, Spinster family, sphingosine-1-phosphate transporter
MRRAAGYTLGVLTLINFLNYVDRWIIASLLESIRKSELHLTDTQLGLIGSGFIIVYMASSPLFGSLGDRRSRPPLIAMGVMIWSIATTLAGFARGFVSLFAARATVGVGEAAYGTIAPALLADAFPYEKRGRVLSIFFVAIPVGSAAGYILGGLVDQHFGWRAAFWVAGAPGLLLAMLVAGVKDPPRGAHDDVQVRDVEQPWWRAYIDLLHNGQFILAALGYAMWTFAIGGLGYWMPAFLERVRGMTHAQATVTFGAIACGTGLAGTFIGGFLGDFFLKRTRQSYLWVSGIATLIAAPFTFVALTSPNRSTYLTAIIIAEVLVFVSAGPVNSAIVNAVAPHERATALGLSVLVTHLLGDVPATPIIGKLSDATSLDRAFLIVPVAIVIGGVIWCVAAWRGR